MSVLAVVKLKAHKGKGVALLAALTVPLERAAAHDGCHGSHLYMGAQSPDELVLLDEWQDEDSHVKHMQALKQEGALEEVEPLLAEPPRTSYYKKTG